MTSGGPRKQGILLPMLSVLCALGLVWILFGGLGKGSEGSDPSCQDSRASQAACKPFSPQDPAGTLSTPLASSQPTTFSSLSDSIDKHRVGQALMGVTANKVWYTVGRQAYYTDAPGDGFPSLADRLADAGATVRYDKDLLPKAAEGGGMGTWIWLLVIAGTMGLPLLFFFLMRMINAGAGGEDLSFKSNQARAVGEMRETVTTFDQVAGCDEVVDEVQEFVDFLRQPDKFTSLGARMPSGLILYGPPGTGKTLVAKALAGEAQVPFFAVSGSEFIEKYVGVGASRIRDLFRDARRSPVGAVIFIDEIDAVARRRGDESHPERDQAVNELLSQMDGFPTTSRVIVVAATNRLDVLDPALLRPGRFSRQVRVGLPDCDGRLQILELYAKDKPLDQDVDLRGLAETTAGCSGADLSNMLNEAAIMAAREGAKTIRAEHLAEGQLRALAGPVKRQSMSPEEIEQVAFHEAGHVLCAELCEDHEKAQRASIRPRGQAGGLALYGQKDRALHSAQYLHEKLICTLGGRAAEWVQYGKVSSGAANDLQQANAIARQAVQELGFSQRTGQVIVSDGGRELNVSDATRRVVDSEVERMVAEAYSEAVNMLEEHRQALDRLAHALLEAEELDRLEILAALNTHGNTLTSKPRNPSAMSPKMVPVLHAEPAQGSASDAKGRQAIKTAKSWWGGLRSPRRRPVA